MFLILLTAGGGFPDCTHFLVGVQRETEGIYLASRCKMFSKWWASTASWNNKSSDLYLNCAQVREPVSSIRNKSLNSSRYMLVFLAWKQMELAFVNTTGLCRRATVIFQILHLSSLLICGYNIHTGLLVQISLSKSSAEKMCNFNI